MKKSEKTILLKSLFVLKLRDRATYEHSLRTAIISTIISRDLFSASKRERIFYGAIAHDLGKLEIDTTILNKPSKLNEIEREIIEKHPQKGLEILSKLRVHDQVVKDIVYLHHYRPRTPEKSYPRELNQTKPRKPFYVEAVTAADIFEALTAKRAYKEPLSKEEALKILSDESIDFRYLLKLKQIELSDIDLMQKYLEKQLERSNFSTIDFKDFLFRIDVETSLKNQFELGKIIDFSSILRQAQSRRIQEKSKAQKSR